MRIVRILRFLTFLSANFSMFIVGGWHPPPTKRYRLVNHLFIILEGIPYPHAGHALTI